MSSELLLIRHGESEANVGLSTDPDSRLTQRGIEQARNLGQRLAAHVDLTGFTALVSPYHRTQHTAAEIASTTGLKFQPNELIREWGVIATINGREFPEETTEHLIARLTEFLQVYAGRKLVIVSHAAPIAVLTQLAWGEVPNVTGQFWHGVTNCCLRRVGATYHMI
ncbi:MAG: histidine phosphatase family protein [Planctomycetota bacterium]|nr:histidine phosphatase family protein [Planctomycetota bacterium]